MQESFQDTLNFFLSNNGLAFAVALVIFVITLWLVVKRLIGFVITLLLLVFALISGFFVANADLFREIVKGFTPTSTPEERETVSQLKSQLYKAYEEFKGELSDQKIEFEKILEKAKQREAVKEVLNKESPVINEPIVPFEKKEETFPKAFKEEKAAEPVLKKEEPIILPVKKAEAPIIELPIPKEAPNVKFV